MRFAKEVAGVEDLGMTGRGNASEIGTYVDRLMKSEISGASFPFYYSPGLFSISTLPSPVKVHHCLARSSCGHIVKATTFFHSRPVNFTIVE